MTTAADRPDPNDSGLRQALAHTGGHAMLAIALTLAAGIIAGIAGVPGWLDTALMLAWLAATSWFVAAGAASIRHRSYLCSTCMTSMPADGKAEAAERLPQLRRFHRWTTTRRTGTAAATLLLLGVAGMFPGVPFTLTGGLTLAVLALAIYWGRLVYIHGRYAPWCPICHPGRGDDQDPAPVPPPVPSGEGIR